MNKIRINTSSTYHIYNFKKFVIQSIRLYKNNNIYTYMYNEKNEKMMNNNNNDNHNII